MVFRKTSRESYRIGTVTLSGKSIDKYLQTEGEGKHISSHLIVAVVERYR